MPTQIIAGLAQFATGVFLLTFAVYYVVCKAKEEAK